MKSRLLSLAALLMAGAASSALAQDQNQPRIENGGPMYNAARAARERQAQQPPANAPPAQPRPQHGPPGPQRQPPAPQAQAAPPPPQPGQRGGWSRPENAPPPAAGPSDNRGDRRSGERQNWGDRGQDRSGPAAGSYGWNGPDQGRQDQGRQDRDRRDRDRQDRDRQDRDRQNWDRRDGDHRDWNRPGDGRGQDWNRDHGRGPPRDGPRWAPRRYPPIYNSPSRYRGAYWRPPEGYYARSWRYGEILPRGWYGPDYLLLDWWSYDLPEPPPGYDWVRVGRDALLIDYSGRIVQVVRLVFW